MIIWILKLGEPLPSDPGTPRALRSGMLATELSKRGHEVTYWTSDVIHHLKIKRSKNERINGPQPWQIKSLRGILYKSNISISRLVHNIQTSLDFLVKSKREKHPDIILSCFPTIELCSAAILFSKTRNIPCAIDIRDRWPDVIVEFFPPIFQRAAKIALAWMFCLTRYSLSKADAITGVSEGTLQWGLAYANRPRTAYDKAFVLSYKRHEFRTGEISHNRNTDDSDFLVVYFGSISRRHLFETVVRAAMQLQRIQKIKFIFCGTGDHEDWLRNLTKGMTNVQMTGWLNENQMTQIATLASLGLIPFSSTQDYHNNYPNKVGEYLQFGIPILSSLDGQCSRLLSEYNCGITYDQGSKDELAKAIILLFNNPEQRRAMSINARRAYEENFDADVNYASMANWLLTLAKDHSRQKANLRHETII